MAEFNGNQEQLPYFNMPSEYSVNVATEEFNGNEALGVYMADDFNMLTDFEHMQDFPDLTSYPTSPTQPFNPSFEAPNVQAPFQQSVTSPVTSTTPTSPTSRQSSSQGAQRTSSSKRHSIEKAPASVKAEDPKEDLNVSAEEDKRRRNTAASARFRVKKKQREQQMEKTAKEMTEKCEVLESRIKELEKENRLLKGLLTEKASGSKGKSRSESGSSDEDHLGTRLSKRGKAVDSR